VKRISKFLIVISALSVLGGCSTIKGITGGGDKKATPTIGKRIDILGIETDSKADPALENISVILPPGQINADWAQPGGNASKAIGHVALGDGLSRAWTASIQGGSNRARLGASPVVSGGKLFAVDTEGQVVAFDAKSGARLWRTSLEIKKDGRPAAFGGGASAEGDMVYATNGAGDVSAVRADTGAIVWQKRPAGPLRGSPTLSNGNVYVMTQDNQIYALRASDGNTEWNESGPVGVSGIFGVGAPSAAQSTIVAGYSTGELAAYRYENGRSLWNDSLSRTSMSTSVSTLTDIDANPVIDRGRVFALGQGGRMAAYELVTGQRIWEINIAGITTPVVSGEWVFVLTSEAKLLCVQRASGKIRWISQLQRYDNDKKKKGAITWRGPVLAGGRLIVASSRGEVWSVTTGEGSATQVFDTKNPVSVGPIVADNMLYLLDDGGHISAFR
jgi:outer membrane protein assembly factor BamB